MLRVYTAIFTQEPEGGITITVPDVPGCVSYAESMPEAFEMARDALGLCLCAYEDEGISYPPRTEISALPHDENRIPTLIDIDLLKYRYENEKKSVRKNVSMPAWMAKRADAMKLNCSKLLQDVLMEKFEQAIQ